MTVLSPDLKTRQATRIGEVQVLADLQVLPEALSGETVERLNSKVAIPSFLQIVEWRTPRRQWLGVVPRFVMVHDYTLNKVV